MEVRPWRPHGMFFISQERTEHIEGRNICMCFEIKVPHGACVLIFGLQAFMKAMDILAGDHRQRFLGFRSFSLDVYYLDSSLRFFLVPLRFVSEAWPRAGLGEPRSALECQQTCFIMAPKTGPKKVLKTWLRLEGPRQ